MDEDDLTAETASPWEGWDAALLDAYLIQECEHPGLNVQSVLVRALLADSVFPGRFERLIGEEFCYAAAASCLLQSERQGWFSSLRDILLGRAEPFGEVAAPAFLTAPVPFDLPALLADLERCREADFSGLESPFETRWREALAPCEVAEPVPVLELACGSANDSRFLSRYGLDRFLRYAGVDFTPKNIVNARRHFPGGEFHVANVCTLPFADRAFDYTYAFDLVEHLEESQLEVALAEAIRVTRRELWLSFFNLDWLPGHDFGHHVDRPLNTLSIEALRTFFQQSGCASYLVDVPNEWPRRFPGYTHYNARAGLLVVRVPSAGLA